MHSKVSRPKTKNVLLRDSCNRILLALFHMQITTKVGSMLLFDVYAFTQDKSRFDSRRYTRLFFFFF